MNKTEVEIKARNGLFLEVKSDLCTITSYGSLPYEAGEKLMLVVSLLVSKSLDQEIESRLLHLLKEIIKIKQNSLESGELEEQIIGRQRGRKKTMADRILAVLQEHSGESMSVPEIAREMLGSSIVENSTIADESKYTSIYIPLNNLVKHGKVQKKELSSPRTDSEGARVQTFYHIINSKER
jgi:hypothetical protein